MEIKGPKVKRSDALTFVAIGLGFAFLAVLGYLAYRYFTAPAVATAPPTSAPAQGVAPPPSGALSVSAQNVLAQIGMPSVDEMQAMTRSSLAALIERLQRALAQLPPTAETARASAYLDLYKA
jgi:hypothetical protein